MSREVEKTLDSIGISHLWKRMVDYVNGIMPKKTSDLVNDAGFITDFSELPPDQRERLRGPRGLQGNQGDQGNPGEPGRGIESIRKTSSSGLTDTYTVTFTDGSSYQYNVVNGKDGADASTQGISYNDLNDKPTIPANLSELQDDAGHRTVSDTEKATWNNKSDFSGNYNDLSEAPDFKTINGESIIGTGDIVIQGSGGDQIQSDWDQSDSTKVDYIKNKPDVYEKPSTGIPFTDLSEAVQTALSAASSAYQKPSSGIPATDLADGVIPDVSRKADKVSGATGGNVAGLNNNGNLTDTGIASSNVVYSSSTGSTVSPVSFDPQADTVHVTSQVLLPAAQAQARTNIAAEGKMNVVTVPSATSTLTPDIGKAYIITDDIAITLPTTTSTDLENIILYITTGTNNAVTISAPSGQTLVYLKGFGTIEDSKMYEINCQWNGSNWIIGKIELEAGT